jgi:hypothetical protein
VVVVAVVVVVAAVAAAAAAQQSPSGKMNMLNLKKTDFLHSRNFVNY